MSEVQGADAIVYGIGSLYTSICPSLILEGVGEAISARHNTIKVSHVAHMAVRVKGGTGAGASAGRVGGLGGTVSCSSLDRGRMFYSFGRDYSLDPHG